MNAASFQSELKYELQSILQYWMQRMPDPRGGFWGRIDEKDQPDPAARSDIEGFGVVAVEAGRVDRGHRSHLHLSGSRVSVARV